MASRLRRDASPTASLFSFLDIITSVTGILILITLILSTEIGGHATRPIAATPSAGDEALNRILATQAEVEAQNARLRRLIATASTAGPLDEIQAQVTAARRELASVETAIAAANARAARLLNELTQADAALGIDDLLARLAVRRGLLANLEQSNVVLRATVVDLDAQTVSASNRLLRARALRGQSWLRPEDSGGKLPQVILVSGAGAEFKPLDAKKPEQFWKTGAALDKFRDFCDGLTASREYVVFLIRPSGIGLFEELRSVARKQRIDVGYDAITESQVIHVGPPPLDEPEPDVPAATETGKEPNGAASGSPSGRSGPAVPKPTGGGETAADGNHTSGPSAVTAGVDEESATPQTPIVTTNAAAEPPPAVPATVPKSKSWWERLVEFVKGVFA